MLGKGVADGEDSAAQSRGQRNPRTGGRNGGKSLVKSGKVCARDIDIAIRQGAKCRLELSFHPEWRTHPA
jgi:hypothetical protein